MITIAYLTCRKDPKIEWFFWSLRREAGSMLRDCVVVVVDYYANDVERRQRIASLASNCVLITHIQPKPTPWQGQYRTTDRDYFAAANARNTAACAAKGDYIVFVDDLSVLLHGWLSAVREHADNRQIVAGAYRKVHRLVVDEAGNLTYWLPYIGGNDGRWVDGRSSPVPCSGQSMFGCSFGIPLEDYLEINGMDECLDGLGFEDVCFGIRLDNAGKKIVYDQRMLTFESEEHHASNGDIPMIRINRPIAGFQDCAWEMLDWIKGKTVSRGTPDLKAIRSHTLIGKPFPQHNGMFIWPDGKTLLG